jgi:prepilin peptidase CpaA
MEPLYPVSPLLFGFLAAAAWSDIKEHRIPNAVTGAGVGTAFACAILLPSGIGWLSLAGLATGFGVFFPLYLLRAMGAGDVKLMAMVGAFLGPVHALGATFSTLVTGGVLAVAVALHRGVVRRMFENLRAMLLTAAVRVQVPGLDLPEATQMTAAKLPFGLAIALGTMVYVAFRLAGWRGFL